MAAGGECYLQILKGVNKGKQETVGNCKMLKADAWLKLSMANKKTREIKEPDQSPFDACYNFPTSYKTTKKWHGTCHTPANALAGAAMNCTCVLQP